MQGLAALALVLAALATACSRSPPAGAVVTADRVLLLATARIPAVEQAIAAVERHNVQATARGGTALTIDFRSVFSRQEATDVVRSLLPEIQRYRVLYTPSQTIARAAQLLAPTLPIVFDGVDDPVSNCLVDSLHRPGRNATGHMHLLPDTELKMMELLLDAFPSVRRVVVLASGHNITPLSCDPDDAVARGEHTPCKPEMNPAHTVVGRLVDAPAIDAYAHRLGIPVTYLVLCEPVDFLRVRDAATGGEPVGFVVPWHSLFDEHPAALASAMAETDRPAVYPNARFVDAGGVLALQPIPDRSKDRASVLALLQVLGGHPPATLPVQSPRGFEIIFNVEAASRQGLAPSRWLMRRADRIVP